MKLHKILLLLALAFLSAAVFFYLDSQGLLTLSFLKNRRETLLAYHAAHPLLTTGAFMAVYILQTALSLPGATLLSLTAGAILGPFLGTACAVTAATIGATLAFLVTRYLFDDFIRTRFGQRLEGINRELEARGLSYLLFLRLVPLFPFFLINLAAGLTSLRLRTFFFGTLIGIIPGGFVIVNTGASLGSIESLSGILSTRVLVSLALLGIFALLPAIYSRFSRRTV